jgi:predicted O-methyltransferase YrrM
MPQYPAQGQWVAYDQYANGLFIPPDPALDDALRDSEAAGLPQHAVSPSQGKLLHLLVRLIGAHRVLEIGTLGGYSTIWFARALPPDGIVVTLEAEPRHAAVARKNIARAGVSDRVDMQVGRAIDTLPLLLAERGGPFDLILIDADKSSNPDYFERSLRLSRPGTLIVADNVVRNGTVLETDSDDDYAIGIRRFNETVAAEPRVLVTSLQMVGSKGYDGMTFLLVV